MEIALIDWIRRLGLEVIECAVSYHTFVKLSFTLDHNRVDCDYRGEPRSKYGH